MAYYVVHMDRENSLGLPTRVRLVGPFEKHTEASLWGAALRHSSIHNPMWQVVELASPIYEFVSV